MDATQATACDQCEDAITSRPISIQVDVYGNAGEDAFAYAQLHIGQSEIATFNDREFCSIGCLTDWIKAREIQ